MSQELARLKNSFLFQGLPDEVLKALVQKMIRRKFRTGEALIRRGEDGDTLYIIDKGHVKIVTVDKEGEELVLNQCGPGEAIGEMSLFDKEPRSAGVIALADTDVLELKQDAFFELLNQRPDMAMNFMRSFSARLRFSSTYIQKAIEWSKKIAEGDYSFMKQFQTSQSGQFKADTDDDKAGQLLSAFFQMVKGVQAREENLKLQVETLTLQIDEVRRRQEFEELTSTDFYAALKEKAQAIRQQRSDKK